MPSENQSQVPFNEQAALEELERLQRALEESRRRRKDATAAFDDFVSSFRKDPVRESRRASAEWPETRPSTLLRDARTFPPPKPIGSRRPFPTTAALAGTVAAIAAGVVLTRMWRSSPAEPQPQPRGVVSSAAPAQSGAGTPLAPTPEPAVAAASASELRALKDVWVRATVDGQRVLERELEAGARVPLDGRTIVIRAGNAGAVRVTIDGQDRGTLGAEGVVVTRTFTASSPR